MPDSMSEDKEFLRVNIFGTDYPLKVGNNIDYIRRVAGYVDTKMKEVHDAKSDRPVHQVAILAALNIADDFFCEKNNNEKAIRDIEEKIKQLSDSLELEIQQKIRDQE